MKLKFLPRPFWSFVMTSIQVFLLQVLCMSVLMANNSHGQPETSVNDLLLTIHFENDNIETVFKKIEGQTDLTFIYKKAIIKNELHFNQAYVQVSLKDLLLEISEKASLAFLRVNDVINVRKMTRGIVDVKEVLNNRTLQGKVIDSETGEPLSSATVGVKEYPNIGTITKPDGTFELEIPDDSQTLVVSFVGFISKEVAIGAQTSIAIALEPNAQSLDEVVVIGYGTQKRSDFTGSVASVPNQRLKQVPNLNVAQAIQGAIPGVNITTTTAGAASEESIMIRGRNSILASNNPLIVVDRVPYNGALRDINVNDIESIEVLKDASATAIYGSRGSNGVILITTKEGRNGTPQISYDGRYSIQRFDRLPNYMSATDFYAFKELREPGNITTTEQENYDNRNFTDWQKLGIRSGSSWQNNLSVSGSTSNLSYYFGGSYLDVKGVTVNDDYRRALGRVNLDVQINDWLSVGTRTQYSDDDRSGLNPDFSDLGRKNPLINPYQANGALTIYPWPEFTDIANPLEPLNYNNTDESRQLVTNNYLLLDFPFIEGLSYRLNTGITERFIDQSTYAGRNTKLGLESGGVADVATSRYTSSVIENILDYSHAFGDHLVGFTGVYSYQKDKSTSDMLHAEGFPNDITTFYNPAQAQVIIPQFRYVRTDLISSMLRLNYGYKEKYFVTFTGRRDGYSGFGENNKWGKFGTVAGAWIVSEEAFFPLKNTFDFFKLRLSFGENGNQAVDPYLSTAKFAEENFVNGGSSLPGMVPDNLANPALSWETSRSLNVGLDFGIIDNTISGSINYFNTNTEDLLLNRTISPVHGIGSITDNIGETKNTGLEFSLGTTQKIAGNITWAANFNYTYTKNEIISLGLGQNGEVDDVASGLFIGKPITANYDFIFDGVWQPNEAAEAATYNSLPGYIKIRDVNGDGEITADDRAIIGQTDPKSIWGMTNTFTYKNFTLSVFVHGVHGVTKANQLFQDASSSSGVRRNVILKNWYTAENPTADFYANDILAGNQQGFSTLPYQNASFIRFKDITMSYNLPASILEKIGLSSATIYFNGRNLITITDWKETDPELNSGRGSIPMQKEYVFGITLTN